MTADGGSGGPSDPTKVRAGVPPEVLEGLDRIDLPGEAKRQVVSLIARAEFSGPLPAASEFRAYGLVVPDAPERILRMAERQQAHDHVVELAVLRSETTYRVLAMSTGGGVFAGLIVGAVACALNGATGVALALAAATGLAGVAAVFVKGRDLTRVRPAPDAAARKDRQVAVKAQDRGQRGRR